MGKADQIAQRSFGGSILSMASGPVLRWALVPLGAAALAPAGLIATGTAGGAAVAAALASPLSVLAARSPGERAHGALAQSKSRRSGDDERKLADVLKRTPGPGGAPGPIGSVPGSPVGPLGDDALYPAPDTFVTDQPGGGDLVLGPSPTGFTPGPGPIFAADVIPGSGGGNGGGGGGTTPGPGTAVTPETPAATSVPEPGTWLMLIAGFGMIGGALRLGRTRIAAGAAHGGALLPGS